MYLQELLPQTKLTLQWESNGDMVIFGDKAEAEEDCRGNEEVIPCTELPPHHQETLKQQIAKNL